MISKIWPGLAIAAIIIGAFFWLRSGCNKPNVLDSSQKVMDSLKTGWEASKRQDSIAIDRLKEKDRVDSQQYADEHTRRIRAEASLQTRKGNALQTISRLDSARTAKDTAGQLTQGANLEQQVKEGIPAIEGFARLTDSMINTCEERVAIKDSIIFFQEKTIRKADTTITAQQLQFEIIHKDDARKTAALKFYKPVAIGGMALAAIFIVVALLHH